MAGRIRNHSPGRLGSSGAQMIVAPPLTPEMAG